MSIYLQSLLTACLQVSANMFVFYINIIAPFYEIDDCFHAQIDFDS